MKAFWTIVKLTCRNAVRSHIFQLLLAILVLCVVFIPATIEGDGTVRGFIQVSLKFSLFAVALMLSLSAVWSSCMTMTQDIEGYQLHMVITKPVGRVTIWLAKWFGIFLIHFVLLLIAAVLVYAVVLTRYNAQLVPDGELERVQTEIAGLEAKMRSMPNSLERDSVEVRLNERRDMAKSLEKRLAEDARIRNEVLIARRAFVTVGSVTLEDGSTVDMPMATPEFVAAKSRDKFRTVLRDNEIRGVVWDAGTQRERLNDIKVEVVKDESLVQYGVDKRKVWRITGLPVGGTNPLYLRFRIFVTKVSDSTERDTLGQWFYGRVINAGNGDTAASNASWEPLNQMPRLYRTNHFIEERLPYEAVDSSGTVLLSFINFDPQQEDMFFQIWDGPNIYAAYGGFTMNYVKSVLIIAMALMVLCGLGCAVSGVFSMPTSIFFVIAYLFVGGLAAAVSSQGYLITSDPLIAAQAEVGSAVGKIILKLVIPLQRFDVSAKVADGVMVEWIYIFKLFFYYCVMRAMPLCLLGIWLYRRREMGLVIKK